MFTTDFKQKNEISIFQGVRALSVFFSAIHVIFWPKFPHAEMTLEKLLITRFFQIIIGVFDSRKLL